MKKITIVSLIMLLGFAYSTDLAAQIQTPAPSPACKMTQTVGLTEVTLEYSRPGKKGRTIFAADGLVPFGKMWRTGANAVTKVTFSDDVTVEGAALKAGTYGIITIPTAESWTVNFYTHESNSWNSYTEKTPAASVNVKTGELPFSVESFTMSVGNITTTTADIHLLWDNVMVNVGIEVEVDSKVMAAIEKTLGGPTVGDYYAAGSYYHDSGKDLNKALEYVQKATMVDEPRFWQVRRESLILADLGRKEEAVKAAKKSLKLAEKAGNADYIKMNKDSIAEWTKM
jgi:hypothetical protein